MAKQTNDAANRATEAMLTLMDIPAKTSITSNNFIKQLALIRPNNLNQDIVDRARALIAPIHRSTLEKVSPGAAKMYDAAFALIRDFDERSS